MVKRIVEKGYEVIALTGRRPVKIKTEDWPVVGEGLSRVGKAFCYVAIRQHKVFTDSFIVRGSYAPDENFGEPVMAAELMENGSCYMDDTLEDVELALMRRAGVLKSFVIPDACVKALDNMPPMSFE